MESLLNRQTVRLSRCVLDCMEECAFNGDYSLPEYCPDVAVVLKCIATPRMQSRQWSGNQLLLDGAVNLRVLYLDEGRCCVRSVEFVLPYSCTLRSEEDCDNAPVSFDQSAKYVNCRAVSPRRIEVHGAIQVHAYAECNCDQEVASIVPAEGLYAQSESVPVTKVIGATEKVVTVSEVLEFPETLPAAEMLLGGDCTAVIKDCKLLTGKAIVRGQLLIHQLYTDNLETGSAHCLDFEVPFSQIMDVNGVEDGQLCRADVLVLSDTERCGVGPDGENTLLEVTAKMLLQLQVFEAQETSLLLDAYHTQYPAEQDAADIECVAFCGCRYEQTVLPMLIQLPEGNLREIVDVWVQPQGNDATSENGAAVVCGKLLVCVLVRDSDGQILYVETPEEYRLEYPCSCNRVKAETTVTELRYRAVDGKLELQVELSVQLCLSQISKKRTIQSLSLQKDRPYPQQKATALLYYAQPGETVWEIGRSCHTSPEAICRENESLVDPITKPSVLLVPIL